MRSLLTAVAVLAAALALGGCPKRQQQPVPGPRSAATASARPGTVPRSAPSRAEDAQERNSPDEINWFQGTLEEAFTRRPRTEDRPRFRY
jgi:hypothetical protein